MNIDNGLPLYYYMNKLIVNEGKGAFTFKVVMSCEEVGLFR